LSEEYVAPSAVERPIVDVNDLVDYLLFKGVIPPDDVRALAVPGPGGPVHKIDRLRYQFDPARREELAKARTANVEREKHIADTNAAYLPPTKAAVAE
jgi:hypothetical protein